MASNTPSALLTPPRWKRSLKLPKACANDPNYAGFIWRKETKHPWSTRPGMFLFLRLFHCFQQAIQITIIVGWALADGNNVYDAVIWSYHEYILN
jgi:hypothetical protein